MKQSKWVLHTLYVVLVLLVLIGGLTVKAHQMSQRPNNQYEILVYPDHYVLMDGDRKVAQFKEGLNPVLDSMIEEDNQ